MADSKTYTGKGLEVLVADPENITRDECLLLARTGADTWNSWRRQFPTTLRTSGAFNQAKFARQNFQSEDIDFTDFEFGDYADFEGAKFKMGAFVAAKFGLAVNFTATLFVTGCAFTKASFGDFATFLGSQFGGPEVVRQN